ncbi:MAG: hypothetical protein IT318_27350 [Anaerolineales bacterium]|nr:hypothetical protein [Anaerolineales bacterium]
MFVVGGLLGLWVVSLQAKVFSGYGTEGAYPEYTLEERVSLSDAIIEGKVVSISSAQYNQDSGEYWDSSDAGPLVYPYHFINVEVVRTLHDSLSLASQVTILQVGNSPLGARPGLSVAVMGHPEHSLQVGDLGVFFVRQMDFPWREGGHRPALQFVGYAEHSYLRRQADGLLHFASAQENALSVDELLSIIHAR